MKRNALVTAAVLFVLLAAAGLLLQQPDRKLTATSFGTAPFGYKALADLLAELAVPVQRNFARFRDLPEHGTVWWIEPTSLCTAAAETPPPGESPEWSGDGWLERGGTAVAFLAGASSCAAVAGVRLPDRIEIAPPDSDAAAPTADAQPAPPRAATPRTVSGSRLKSPRSLTMDKVRVFAEAADWNVSAAVDGKPFILERNVGVGRLVVVADAQFLTNAWLDHGDSAPLAMDMVRAFGAPLIDERDHGFGASRGAFAYLWSSPARALLLGLAMLGAAFAWWGAALPPRTADAAAPPSPTLESYVSSMATLYARAGDHAAVAAQYHRFALSQLRRQSGMAPDAPAEAVIERLSRHGIVSAAEAGLLRQAPRVASAEELRQQTQRFDEIMRKAAT